MTVKFVNFFKSKIADVGGIGSGDTEFTLSAGDGAKMPNLSGGHHCYLVFVDSSSNREVVKVTEVASDTCTIVRGQDGTTPRAFSQNDLVELRLTRGSLEDIIALLSDGATITFDNEGLHIYDTDDSHDLIIKPGSDLTADRILTLVTGDAARSLSIENDAVVDQDLSIDATPQFAGLNVKLDNLATPDDNTDLDASITKHGLLPKFRSQTSPMPRGHLAGLQLSNNATDADHDIDISIGECRSDDDTTSIFQDTALVKRIDAVWAAGTNQGGLDTGVVAIDEEYHVYEIYNPTTDTVDTLLTITYGSPTMPSNYTKKRILGSIFTDGSANILPFSQGGDEFLRADPPFDIDVADQGTTAVTRTLSVATGRKVHAILNAYIAAAVAPIVYLSSLDVTDEAPSTLAAPLATLGGNFLSQMTNVIIRTNTSGQIRSRSSQSDTVLRIATLGYIDRRGKDD